MRNITDEVKLRRRRIAFLILALLPFISLPLIGSQLYFRQDDSALLLWAKEFTMPFYQAFSTDQSITNFANYPGMGAYWRPFAYLYIKALWHIFGPVPAPYRIVGGLIFMTAIYFFFRLVEQRSGDKAAVMSCLALFAAFFETFPSLFLLTVPALYLFQIAMIYYFYSYLQRPRWFYLLGIFIFVVPSMSRQTTPFLLTAILIAVLIEQRGSLTIFSRRYLYVLVSLVLSFYLLTFSYGSSNSSILGSIDLQYGIWYGIREAWEFLTKRFFYYGTILTSGITGILLLLLFGGSVLRHLAKVVKERFHFHTIDRIWLPMTFLLTFIMMKLQPYGIYWLIFCCLYLFVFDKELRLPIAWAGASLACFLSVKYYHNTYLLESGFPFAMTMGIIMARVIDPVVFRWEKHVKASFNRRTALALGIALLMLPVAFMFSSKFPILSEKIDIIKVVIASNKNFAQLMDYLQRELPRSAIIYEMDELELGIGDSPYLSLKEKAKYVKNMNIGDKQVMLKVLGRNDIKIYPSFFLEDPMPEGKVYFITLNDLEKEIAQTRLRLKPIREFRSSAGSTAIYRILPIVFSPDTDVTFGKDIDIIVSNNQTPKKINPLVYGNNMIGYDPTHLESRLPYFGYSNYGAGVWNPKTMKSIPEVIRLAKEIGITILRFPGGNHSWFYNWKKTIGPPEQRPDFLYGLDEFLRTCEEIGAEAIFTLPYFTGSPQDAADLVEYLNAPDDGSNPNGGVDWAGERAKNGHSLPYKVSFFELGSELMYGEYEKGIKPADPIKYVNDYFIYKKVMKAVDPSIQLGAVIVNSHSGEDRKLAWNDKLFRVAGYEIDFLIVHSYHPWYTSNDTEVDPNKLFKYTLRNLNDAEIYYKSLARRFETITGRKNIPIAITEYNAGFVQNNPVPFRHSLGTALFNAGLLQIMMKPENNILMANYWQFVNSYRGMIKNDQFMEGMGSYIKRPNFYVFEMFRKHFGTELLDVTANLAKTVNKNKNLLSDALSVSASKSKDGKKLYLMALNKNVYEDIEVTILPKGFKLAESVDVWTLNGPSVWATNEKSPNNMKITHKNVEIDNTNEMEYIFPAHSLTSLEFELK